MYDYIIIYIIIMYMYDYIIIDIIIHVVIKLKKLYKYIQSKLTCVSW